MKITNEEEYQQALRKIDELDRLISLKPKSSWESCCDRYMRGIIAEAVYNYEHRGDKRVKITYESEYKQALRRLDKIWSVKNLNDSEKEERKALVEEILRYEDATVEIPKPSTIDAISFRKEQSTVELDESDYQQVYDEFWKHLVETDGVLDTEQVKKELCDYYNMIQEMMTLTYDLTDGLLSYPSYKASTILMEHGAICDKVVAEAVEEEVKHYKDRIKDLEEDNVKLTEDVGRLERKVVILQGELASCRKDLEESEKQKESIRKQAVDFEEQCRLATLRFDMLKQSRSYY